MGVAGEELVVMKLLLQHEVLDAIRYMIVKLAVAGHMMKRTANIKVHNIVSYLYSSTAAIVEYGFFSWGRGYSVSVKEKRYEYAPNMTTWQSK